MGPFFGCIASWAVWREWEAWPGRPADYQSPLPSLDCALRLGWGTPEIEQPPQERPPSPEFHPRLGLATLARVAALTLQSNVDRSLPLLFLSTAEMSWNKSRDVVKPEGCGRQGPVASDLPPTPHQGRGLQEARNTLEVIFYMFVCFFKSVFSTQYFGLFQLEDVKNTFIVQK